MKSGSLLQRLLQAALITSAAALFVVVAFPHVHGAATSHRTESCRACKIQEGFSAETPAGKAAVIHSASLFQAVITPVEAPCLDRVAHASSPRAPPQAS